MSEVVQDPLGFRCLDGFDASMHVWTENHCFFPGCGSCSELNAFCYMKLLLSKSQLTAGSVAVFNLSAKKWARPRNARNSQLKHRSPAHKSTNCLSLPISLLLTV